MQPDPEDFAEWLQLPVTEWVLSCLRKQAAAQRGKWAELAWSGELSPLLLNEAKVRADCYMAIPESAFEDWKAIDDTKD